MYNLHNLYNGSVTALYSQLEQNNFNKSITVKITIYIICHKKTNWISKLFNFSLRLIAPSTINPLRIDVLKNKLFTNKSFKNKPSKNKPFKNEPFRNKRLKKSNFCLPSSKGVYPFFFETAILYIYVILSFNIESIQLWRRK